MKKLNFLCLVTLIYICISSCLKKVDVEQTGTSAGLINVTPTEGTKNTIINISGNQFPDASGITVTVNGKTAVIIGSTSTNIQAKVASGSGSGPVVVSFGGKGYTGPNFNYINSSFIVTSITNGIQGYLDGPVTTAQYEDIEGISIDGADNLYNAQYGSSSTQNKVRKLNLNTLIVSTLDSAVGGGAEFLSSDAAGNVFVADEDNNQITKIDPSGTASLLASPAFAIQGIKVAKSGNIYVSGPTTIAKFSSTGNLIWSLISHDSAGPANVDGDTSLAQFSLYGNIEVDDTEKNIYVQNTNPGGVPTSIKLLSLTDNTITTIAGSPTVRGNVDGAASSARFGLIYSVILDKEGGLYIADASNNTIRYLNNGNVRTVIGGVKGDQDGNGLNVKLSNPQGFAWDSKGNLYVSDYSNYKIKKIEIE